MLWYKFEIEYYYGAIFARNWKNTRAYLPFRNYVGKLLYSFDKRLVRYLVDFQSRKFLEWVTYVQITLKKYE